MIDNLEVALTDNDVVKTLEFVARYCKDEYNEIRVDQLLLSTIALIKRQQAEIERLQYLLDEEEKKYTICAKHFYKEGIKEFVRRLKDRVVEKYEHTDVRIFKEIDNLVNEMTEENKDDNT